MGDEARPAGRQVELFLKARRALWNLLPFGIDQLIPESFVGFAMLNLFTFSMDLVVLTIGFQFLHLPNPVAVTIGYLVGFGLAYVLNRWLNFRSEAPIGSSTARYALVVAINFACFILGVGSGLQAMGVHFALSRILAGLCEAAWMYTMMRWFVFREPKQG